MAESILGVGVSRSVTRATTPIIRLSPVEADPPRAGVPAICHIRWISTRSRRSAFRGNESSCPVPAIAEREPQGPRRWIAKRPGSRPLPKGHCSVMSTHNGRRTKGQLRPIPKADYCGRYPTRTAAQQLRFRR